MGSQQKCFAERPGHAYQSGIFGHVLQANWNATNSVEVASKSNAVDSVV